MSIRYQRFDADAPREGRRRRAGPPGDPSEVSVQTLALMRFDHQRDLNTARLRWFLLGLFVGGVCGWLLGVFCIAMAHAK